MPPAFSIMRLLGPVIAVAFLTLPEPAGAAPPATPVITEPSAEGAFAHPGDVHMEATGFSDTDGDAHLCSDWEISTVSSSEPVWEAPCVADVQRVHIHLADGAFVNTYAGRTELRFAADYTLRIRFRTDIGESSPWASRGFSTYPPSSPGGAVPWTPLRAGFKVKTVTDDLQLPVNVAVNPDPGERRGDPVVYVAELYGTIKTVTRAGKVGEYATGLLNFNPTGLFPGSGAQGLAGLVVDPSSGDLFASMLYEDPLSGLHYPKLVRLESANDGRTARRQTTILDMAGETQGQSHQISNLTIGPDRKLYVHVGDGFEPSTATDLDSFRGKIVRLNLNGSAVRRNPFYDASDGITARDYVYAYGFRNPFGGAWRAANASHYEVENGPSVDRLAKVTRGTNYTYDGSDASMRFGAIYNWAPAHAPVNIAFVEPETFSGSGFPASDMDHAFVTESGPTYAAGPQLLGKRIVEFEPSASGELGGHPHGFVEYTGTGRATALGLAAGPEGLYFTDLYKDLGSSSPIEPGARLLLVKYARRAVECATSGPTLHVSVGRGREAVIARGRAGSVRVNGRKCPGASVTRLDRISVQGGSGRQQVTLDLTNGPLSPGKADESRGRSEIELEVSLGPGRDTLAADGGSGRDRIRLLDAGARVNGDRDTDVRAAGVESFRARGRGGDDRLGGNSGPNLLQGGSGADALLGGAGADDLEGMTGTDRFVGGPGSDQCDDHGREPARSCER